MIDNAPDTDELLRRCAAGDSAARNQLLNRHRDRLKRTVEARLDPRLRARVDSSDVVQDALVEANGKMDDYLRERPIPFYSWLRQIALQRMTKLHEHHKSLKRDVQREQGQATGWLGGSEGALAQLMADSGMGPCEHLLREERRRRVREALERLSPSDREVLALRHLDHLSPAEVAVVLGISEGAVKMRHARALIRLQALLSEEEQP